MPSISQEVLSRALLRAGFVGDEVQSLQRYLGSLTHSERLEFLERLLEAARGRLGPKLSIPHFQEEQQLQEEQQRSLILDARKAEAVPLCFLRDPSRRVRRALAEQLVETDWEGRGPLLSALVHDSDPQVRRSVRRGLAPGLVHVLETAETPAMPIVQGAGAEEVALPPPPAKTGKAVPGPLLPPDEIQRYTDLTFEPRPDNSSSGLLKIALRIESRRGDQEALDLKVPPGKNESLVLVHASSLSFSVEPSMQPIRVPRAEDSETAIFEISARVAGKGRVRLTLWDEYHLIGSLVADLEARGTARDLELVWDGSQVFLDPSTTAPRSPQGVTIQVGWVGGGDRHIEYWAHVPEDESHGADLVPIGRSAVRYDPDGGHASLTALRTEIDQILTHLDDPQTLGASSRAEALDTLGGDLDSVGRQIASDLLSEEVRSLLFATRSVVQWAVKDPELDAIPWELARLPLTRSAVVEELVLLRTPVGPGPGLEAYRDAPPSPPEEGSKKPRLVYLLGKEVGGPQYFPQFGEVVDSIKHQYDVVTNFLSEKGWEALSRAEIRKRVAGAQVVHILCHGKVDEERGVSLEIGQPPLGGLRPEHVLGLKLEPGALVVVSACSSAASGFTPAGVRSFGWNFIRAGASVYLGTLAPVTPTVAMAFARAFFDARLRERCEIPEAIRRARRETARGQDPTWMFYVVYGDLTREPTYGDA
jgi:hypothetical protein